MNMQSIGKRLANWVRDWMLGDTREVVARLEREVDEVRRALHDPMTIKPLIVEALRVQIQEAPQEIAAVLAPVVDGIVRRREAQMRLLRAKRSARWVSAAAVVIGTAAVLMWWFRTTGVSEATALSAPTASAAAAASPLLLEERAEGFGLGAAGVSDDALASAVRERLGACPELAGSSVSFAVKDGWVWLRGETSAAARESAQRALDDLGERVTVVNQLIVASAPDAVAER